MALATGSLPLASSDATTQSHYTPLDGSEIRLVRFLDNPGQTHLELLIEHYRVEDAPPYLALSYVWGDLNETRPIRLNGRPFHVTENLFEAVQHIRSLAPSFAEGLHAEDAQAELHLWIDAVCVDQGSPTEKSTQVARMGRIFSSAYTVPVWLGTPESLGLDAVGFTALLQVLDSVSPSKEFTGRLAGAGIARQPHERQSEISKMILSYFKVLDGPWFRRVWVLQEYVLSQRAPVALIGHTLFSFQALYASASPLQRLRDQAEVIDSGVDVTRMLKFFVESAFGSMYLPEWINSVEFQKKSTACQLLWLLGCSRSKKATIPHDQMYGLLGMIDPANLPSSLQPDYRQAYPEVCKRYSRFLIENTGDLRTLTWGYHASEFDDQPSWVRDCLSLRYGVAEPTTRHTGRFSLDGQCLDVEAARTGKAMLFFPLGDPKDVGERMQDFIETVLAASAGIKRQPLAIVWENWLKRFLKRDCRLTVRLADRYPTPTTFLHAFRVCASSTGGDRDLRPTLTLFGMREYVLLADGEVAVLARHQGPELIEGQEVFALRGATRRAILYKFDSNRYRYAGTLIGQNDDLVLDERYFARYSTQNLVLI